jgi:MoaA/NifB/PqqE/SkfB family radical SAM enzyme
MELNKRKVHYFFESREEKSRLEEFLKKRDCYPLDIVLHLTTTCNHNCNFCSNYYRINERELRASIETKDILNFIDEFESLGMKNLVVSGGGEPFLHKGISKILLRLNRSSLNSFLYTNLDVELTPEILQQLSPSISVGVNINTLDPNVYKVTRGKKANLERVKTNISCLVKRDIPIGAIIIVREDVIGSLEETIEGLINFGIQKIIVSPAFNLPYRDGVGVGQTAIEKIATLKEDFSTEAVRIIEPVGQPAVYEQGVFCKSLYFDITIGADYFLYPCCINVYNPRFQLVNLKIYNSFSEAWQSRERKQKFEKFSPTCKTCWFGPVNEILLKKWKDR